MLHRTTLCAAFLTAAALNGGTAVVILMTL